MALEELVGRLSTVDSYSDDEEEGGGGKLYLTEEQWQARARKQEQEGSGGSSKSRGSSGTQNNRRGQGRQCRKPRRQRRGEVNLTQGEEEPTLLMAHAMGVSLAGEETLGRTPGVHEIAGRDRKEQAVVARKQYDELNRNWASGSERSIRIMSIAVNKMPPRIKDDVASE
ncbi:hypothetical protein OsJ_27785 [Oryza sativa Japonica Group]|uniref:Uncharacterized protein n=1 Tax=Oryza sativa subsp. japonica TaxID=39947 RepID=B9G1K4_ORYSJ|nr:hypothetical protein OsJ_27785 [Oryza sativa Japonica Group]